MVNNRRMTILQAVVEDYIRTQEPVGSATLARKHNLGVSSATVRNDMAALEEEEYLLQPHHSAGRIPAEKGYRYFVDRLAKVAALSTAQKRAIQNFLSGSVNLDDVLHRSVQLLAQLTGQVAVVASPRLNRSTLRHIELIAVSQSVVLAVIITDTGRVEQRNLTSHHAISQHELQILSNFINDICQGKTLHSAVTQLQQSISHPNEDNIYLGALNPLIFKELITKIIAIFTDLDSQEQPENLYMSGTAHLVHGRMSSIDDVTQLFDALEEQIVLMRLMGNMSESAQPNEVGVAIGSETHTPQLLHAAIVTTGYGHASQKSADFSSSTPESISESVSDFDTPVAFVGSIGPTHMDYATTIAAVKAVALYLTQFLSETIDPDRTA